jgi:hypothetical protein
MAIAEFGNTSADMRLVDDFYGIPALANFVTYLDNFDSVREERSFPAPNQIVIREFNAANEVITLTATGTPPLGPFNTLSAEAIGIRETVNGTISITQDGDVFGTATAASAVNVSDGSLIARVSGINLPIDDAFFPADSVVLAGNDTVTSGSGNDYLLGYAGDDTVSSQAGNDSLEGGPGKDSLDGGAGSDTAVFSAPMSAYTVLAAPDGRVAVGHDGNGSDGLDRLTSIETLQFADGAVPASAADRALEYIASYGDLSQALGANAQAGFDHYVGSGYAEGRGVTFNGLEYIASYGDLANALGANVDAGASHYITNGRFEGRTTSFNGLEYIASYGDLANAFGVNDDAGASHYISSGRFEGRTTSFNGLEYIASYADLIGAFGANEDTGASHYIANGRFEGRMTSFDGLQYIASYGDLVSAFGGSNFRGVGAAEDSGAGHFIGNGFGEGRARDTFDAAQYLANYADLQAAFGSDTQAATVHYVTNGHIEGRTDESLT